MNIKKLDAIIESIVFLYSLTTNKIKDTAKNINVIIKHIINNFSI